jgi:hypothetical protein
MPEKTTPPARRKPDDERCDATFQFRLPTHEKQQFMEACESRSVSHTKLLRSWMRRYVAAYHPNNAQPEQE